MQHVFQKSNLPKYSLYFKNFYATLFYTALSAGAQPGCVRAPTKPLREKACSICRGQLKDKPRRNSEDFLPFLEFLETK